MTWPDYRGNLDWLKASTILLVKHGSQAYGTATPESDTDYKGVAVPPAKYFHGYLDRFDQAESHEPDLAIYDIRKFFKLAADCNPSIIEVLWVDDEHTVQLAGAGERLREARHMFLSQRARHTFSGYAIAQLKRIKTHKEWLTNPQKSAPERIQFGLAEHVPVPSSEYGAMLAMSEQGTLPQAALTLFIKEREYRAARARYGQYQNWLATRNPARAELEAKHGYDTKHGMHLVRLMRMCKEILTTGQVRVKRDDAEELLSIRNGAWSYEKLIDWADKMDGEMDLWMKDSPLPHSPDRVALDKVCCEIVESML